MSFQDTHKMAGRKFIEVRRGAENQR